MSRLKLTACIDLDCIFLAMMVLCRELSKDLVLLAVQSLELSKPFVAREFISRLKKCLALLLIKHFLSES